MSFCMKTYLRDRHVRLVSEKRCITCEAEHSGKHVRCRDCHKRHCDDSRARYKPTDSGYTCSACGNIGHNRRTCAVARAT